MFITIEISTPFQRKPGFFKCDGVTSWRVWWGWFAISCHPMRFDQMVTMIENHIIEWKSPIPFADSSTSAAAELTAAEKEFKL